MSIETDARQEAERRWPSPNSGLYEGLIIGFEKGAVWASEQPEREPSDADVRAALSEWYRGIFSGGWTEQDEARITRSPRRPGGASWLR